MSEDLPPAICATCQRALLAVTSLSGVGYQHPSFDSVDHEVVPVKPGPDWCGPCDFCSDPKSVYALPVRDFRAPQAETFMSTDSWLACETCGNLIASNQWTQLTAIINRKFTAKYGAHPGTLYHDLHQAIRDNVTGPLHRLGGSTT